ncbi:MAG: hypothetical protein PsegKO_24410 [Pseudohongiellaceae bacterium]|jgi:predicted methyltransferase
MNMLTAAGVRVHCLAGLAALSCAVASLSAPAAELDTDALQRALSGPDRDVNDFVRDQARKPVAVLAWLGLEPGMTVLDVYAAGGYYTFILAKAVGSGGRVFAQNTPRGLAFEEDRQDITQGEALRRKIARANLDNVTHLVQHIEDLDLTDASLDAVLIAQVLHDFYNPDPQRALAMLQQVYRKLKPGGFVGVTDHVGIPGNNNRELHRMQISQAISLAEMAGFAVEQSDLLRNPRDDYRRSIFDPRLNRNTDRFLLKLVKPVSPRTD